MTEKINLDHMLSLPPGHVIDAIPPGERSKYYLRGASLGGLALNAAHGVNHVSPRPDLYIHVATDPTDEGYQYARSHAAMLAHAGTYPGHISVEELDELATLAGRKSMGLPNPPGIVFGLARDRHQLVQHPVTRQPAIGYAVPFADIDPYSQRALSELWRVDVSNLPPTPGVVRQIPEGPPPDIF